MPQWFCWYTSPLTGCTRRQCTSWPYSGSGSRVRPRRALPAGASGERRRVPAEPLRHLSPRPRRLALGAHRAGDAPAHRRRRLPAGAASARPEVVVGLPDGRRHGVAACSHRRQARGLRQPRCGRKLAASRPGLAARAGVVHREAAGDVRRRARSARALLRHHRRRGVGELRRGRALALPVPAPSAHLLGGSGARRLKVLLPTPLVEYTARRREVEAQGATLADLLADLDRRYPGIRFRIVDEQDEIRPHIKIFVNRAQEASLARPLAVRDEVLVVAALSGG